MKEDKRMHSRNIYRQRPDFQQMAIDYPEFRKIAIQDIGGKIHIDFKDEESLRILTKTLLKKDFDLDVNLPAPFLIPTVPLRLNYILWIEDLLAVMKCDSEVYGIDIGTGASAIYTLLGAKKNKWHMVGTDIDADSAKYAQENVSKNNLDDLITVILNNEKDPLLNFVSESEQQYDFCMCNPPFYSTLDELTVQKAPTSNRPEPKNAPTGQIFEIVTPGGEEEFIRRIIDESVNLKTKIRLYTTMLGHKKVIPSLVEYLKSHDVINLHITQFNQRNTSRWAIAWTFCENVNLRELLVNFKVYPKKQKVEKPLIYIIPEANDITNFQDCVDKLKIYFNELEFTYKGTEKSELYTFEINAYKNTWIHQRQTRREQERLKNTIQIVPLDSDPPNKTETETKSADIPTQSVSKDDQEVPVNQSQSHNASEKRPLEQCCECSKTKKIKLEDDYIAPLISFNLAIEKCNSIHGYQLTMIRTGGTGNNDLLHQILQFFKNKFK